MTRLLIIGAMGGELGQAARLATARGASLTQVEGVSAGIAHLRAHGADLVLADAAHDLPWLLERLDAERIAAPLVVCGRNAEAEAVLRAIRAGARDFLPLPPDAELIAAMLAAVTAAREGPVCQDPAMTAVLARAEQVARAEASVLITGESGTGKEVLARHIHAASKRARGPFVALNVAALPETLLESELFGHEKGAFSGAIAMRRGKFEQAEGGTILLDEIGEMEARLQAKLLRAIQEREVDRLGGTAPVKVDVRILAATHRDLPAEVRAGRFREDLYFRLNVIQLHIPPLRARPADILPLARHFAQRYAAANGLPARPLSLRAEARLLAHPWPGNVRELENALHRAVLLAEGREVDEHAIELTAPLPMDAAPIAATAVAQTPAATAPSGMAGVPVAALVGRRMEEVEQALILETLGRCLGNRTRAAEILGISIRTLRNKLAEYRDRGLAVTPAPGQMPMAAWPAA